MAGPTWLTYPELGCGCALSGAGLVTCMHCTDRKLGAVRCTRPVVSVQVYFTAVGQHTQRPGRRHSAPGWLCVLNYVTCICWRRPGHTLLLQPITAAPDAEDVCAASATESLHADCELTAESLGAVSPCIPCSGAMSAPASGAGLVTHMIQLTLQALLSYSRTYMVSLHTHYMHEIARSEIRPAPHNASMAYLAAIGAQHLAPAWSHT